jgi:hypothetical protein
MFTVKSPSSPTGALWESMLIPREAGPSILDLSLTELLFSTGGSAQAGQVCTRLALRKLGDRVQLLTLLVMQLKNKVRCSC